MPYDCGLFFTRDAKALPALLGPSAANTPAYLASSSSGPDLIPSPLYVNIENSRRFRALPLFASLLSLGKEGYAGKCRLTLSFHWTGCASLGLTADIIRRNVAFAQRIASYLASHPSYQLLNTSPDWLTNGQVIPLNIVLFRGAPGSRHGDEADSHTKLTAAINGTRKMYVTGTQWRGMGAVRLAVSNWRTGDADWEIVKGVLDEVMA